jgi:hypothetical protein
MAHVTPAGSSMCKDDNINNPVTKLRSFFWLPYKALAC